MIKNNRKLLYKILAVPVAILLIVIYIFYLKYKNSQISEIEILNNTITLFEGETINAEYRIKPEKAKNEPLLWVTDNETIVTVDHGVITGLKTGFANIWVSSKNHPEIKNQIMVTVTTKLGRLKDRLVKTYNFETKDKVVYTSNNGYLFDFGNNVFVLNGNSLIYTYFYKENYIIAAPPSNNSNSIIRIELSTGNQYCSSNGANWCEENNNEEVTRMSRYVLDIFNGCLGRETTADDI